MPLFTAARKGRILWDGLTTPVVLHSEFDLEQIVLDAQSAVPPVWPLQDYVAVNPFLGLSSSHFLDAGARLRRVRDVETLPSIEQLREIFQRGGFDQDDVAAVAIRWGEERVDDGIVPPSTARLLAALSGEGDIETRGYVGVRSMAELLAETGGTDWLRIITNDLSSFCAAHFDDGQAAWPSPWKHLELFAAWLESSQIDQRLERLGISAFREFVTRLPSRPIDALRDLLTRSGVAPEHWRTLLDAELASIAGWASFVRYRTQHLPEAQRINSDLAGLAAIRLAYDVALLLADIQPDMAIRFREQFETAGDDSAARPSQDELLRYGLLLAAEIGYQRRLLSQLSEASSESRGTRKSAQLVFCIDVRSEVIRRHLESVDDLVETFGFAGFFGLPFEYVELGADQGPAQCPVLLQPAFKVREAVEGASDDEAHRFVEKRARLRNWRLAWKSFQSSTFSCFSYVESLGLGYAVKLLTDSLGFTRPAPLSRFDGVPRRLHRQVGPVLKSACERAIPLKRQVELARGILTNLGLTDGFARLVVLCGHGCETTNNPYRGGLDCGACGGHTGEANARLACRILNSSRVRELLAESGLRVPHDTWFVAGLHNTTIDEITLFDRHAIPASHASDVVALEVTLAQAGRLTRLERIGRMGATSAEDTFRRAKDWSEIRPEWGLAGNAAFVVGRRSLTRGTSLGGRTFLHSYDHRKDPDHKVLELIMTAPMVVTNWINLQYYASTVDNVAYGSGNKVLHNVVGQLGILEGNAGDLRTGLPWQSVHDGTRMQHDPLRLTVVIEAPRTAIDSILDKHANIRDLVENGWMYLAACESGQFYRRRADGTWAVAA